MKNHLMWIKNSTTLKWGFCRWAFVRYDPLEPELLFMKISGHTVWAGLLTAGSITHSGITEQASSLPQQHKAPVAPCIITIIQERETSELADSQGNNAGL